MKGAVIISSESIAKQIVSWERIDEVWLIDRSNFPFRVPSQYSIPVKHVPELSPSPELFRIRLSLKDHGKWDGLAFLEIYAPRFLHEMLEYVARAKLKELTQLTEKGKIILLVSHCEEEAMCHRSIICGLLQGRGVNSQSILDVPTDYSEYYRYYLKLWKQKLAKGGVFNVFDV